MIWLDNSRIFAIFIVVLLHTSGRVMSGFDVGTENWWIGNFFNAFTRWAVPVFVMISGSLLLDPSKVESMDTFYKKRLSKLLIPILFWSALYLLWMVFIGTLNGNPPSIILLMKSLFSGKPYYHMWFLYMIIFLYLFTPFFRKIVAHSTRSELLLFVIFTLPLAALNAIANAYSPDGPTIFFRWFLSYIPFFFLGYLIRTDKREYSKTILGCVFLFSYGLIIFGNLAFAGSQNERLIEGNLSIPVILMSVSMMYLLKYWNNPIHNQNTTKLLSSLVLGVYLIHPMFLDSMLYLDIGPRSFYPLLSIPMVTLVIFGLSLLMSWLITQVPYLKRVL